MIKQLAVSKSHLVLPPKMNNLMVLTKKQILDASRGGIDIFQMDIPSEIRKGKNYKCPDFIKSNDKNPSLSFFLDTDRWIYKDHGSDAKGDCFNWIAQKYRTNDFPEVLKKAAEAVGIIDNAENNRNQKTHATTKNKPHKAKSLSKSNNIPYPSARYESGAQWKYWERFGVMVLPDNVIALKWFQTNGGIKVKATQNNPAFAFVKNKNCIKVYQPLNPNKSLKWQWVGPKPLGDNIWGVEALPDSGKELIIVEGPKDWLTLSSFEIPEGISVVGLDAVRTDIPDEWIGEMSSRFDKITLWLDNDEDGHTESEKWAKRYGLDQQSVKDTYTDVSEVIEKIVANGGVLADFVDKITYEGKPMDLETVGLAPSVALDGTKFQQKLKDTVIHPALYEPFVYPGELTFCFGPSNVGKTLWMWQVALDVVRHGGKSLYFDFEMTLPQLKHRYEKIEFPSNFLYIGKDSYRIDENKNRLDHIRDFILNEIAHHKPDLITIDTITSLEGEADTSKRSEAVKIVRMLQGIRDKHPTLAVHVSGHLRKGASGHGGYHQIFLEDLLGSGGFTQLFDAAYVVNYVKPETEADISLRYIKQVKVRSAQIFKYPITKCKVFQIRKQNNGMPMFFSTGEYAPEFNLVPPDGAGTSKRKIIWENEAKNLYLFKENAQIASNIPVTYKAISEAFGGQLGSKDTVQRKIEWYRENQKNTAGGSGET